MKKLSEIKQPLVAVLEAQLVAFCLAAIAVRAMKDRNYGAQKTAKSGAKYGTFDNSIQLKKPTFLKNVNLIVKKKGLTSAF